MESTEGFAKLREEILNQALPLLDSDTIPPEDRFRLSLQVAQMKGSLEAYTKAFRIAEKMEGDDKLLAYLDLLNDVDYVLQDARPDASGASDRATESGKEDTSRASAEQLTQEDGKLEEQQY